MRLLAALIGAALVAASPASAATLTTLLSGGSITVDDVTFDSFNFNPGDDFGTVSVNTDDVDVTGGSAATTVWLDFVFDPALEVSGDSDFIAYIFSFIASVDAPSTRNIIGATLSFMGDAIDIAGDAVASVNLSLDASVFLSIFDDSLGGTQSSDSAAVGPTQSTSVETQWSLQGFDLAALARVTSYRLTLTLDDDAPVVPLPAAAPLFIAGLGALGCVGRRRRKA